MIRSMSMDEKWLKECFDLNIADIDDAIEARADWWTDSRRGFNAYRCIPPGAKNFPWTNCSNLIPPLTTNLCEDTKRRIVMYFVQGREYITLTGMKKSVDMLGSARKVQEFLRWQADAELDYLQFCDAFVGQFTVGGSAFGFTDWAHDKMIVADALAIGRDRLKVDRPGGDPKYQPVGEPLRRKARIEDVLKEVFGSQGLTYGVVKPVRKSSDKAVETYLVNYKDERNKPRKATVTVDRSEELGDDIEVVAEMLRVVRNQPVLRALPAERVIVPPGDHTVHTAPFVAIKGWMGWDQVKEHWRTGFWISSKAEKQKLNEMFEAQTKQMNERTDRGGEDWGRGSETGAQDDQDRYIGVDSQKFRRRQVPIITIYRRWPILKDRPDERPEAAITILPKHNMVVRVQHASIDSRAGIGKRPLVSHHFVRSLSEFYGVGLPRILDSTQEELNATTNMQIDAMNVTSNPILFLDHTAAFARDRASYHPGAVIRVNSPQQNVMIPQWPSRLGEFETQIARLNAFGQQLANQTPSPPEISGSNRTARGAQLLVTERNFNVVYDARMVGTAIEDLWQQIHSWDAALMSPKKEIALFGTDEIAQPFVVSREEVRGKYMFRFEAGQAILNDAIRRDMMTEWFQLIAPIAQAPSEQVPKPLWELAVELGKQRGIKDAERFLPEPSDHFGKPLQPSVEHEIFLMGRVVPVHPADIDQVHVSDHLQFAATEEFAKMPPELVSAFGDHILLHQRRIAAAQAATQGAGQGSVGPTGVTLGGRLALQNNPLVNAGQGAPATTQPQAPGAPVSVLG